jgi:hypothetical protein
MSDDYLRIGDAERDAAAAALGEHYAQGRLTAEEHSERLDRIWAARTRGELGPIFRDLPGRYGPQVPHPAYPAPAYRPGGRAPVRRGLPKPFMVLLVVLLVLAIATHLPLLVAGVLIWYLVVGRHRRHPRARHR